MGHHFPLKCYVNVNYEATHRSNLSQAVYCQQHKIPSHIFSYYRKKLGYVSSSKQVNTEFPTSNAIKVSHSNGFSLEINSDTT
ncbi:IS66 family insertion sequence element accessory protein TnpA [sulfur-oxidizing endosymbiont of Gigantopelta aegis]|uniref:IS66 family insertion sequence element accessory protein TnpA n=1 Tax=sulfur-oxidizing endosymbiont of Gigantopelta aegis TaxID=2794934 RepID=UPI003CCD76E7